MDVSVFVQMLVGILLPFLLAAVRNPASIVKLRRSLPALESIYAAMGTLIDLIKQKSNAKLTTKSHALTALRGAIIDLESYQYEIK